MPLPKQIQQQADQVAAYEASLNTPSPDESNTPVVHPEEPSPAVPEPVPAPAPATDPRDSDPEYWKQRFQTVQGLLEAANDRNRDMQQSQQAMQQQMAALSQQVAALSQKPAPTPTADDAPLVTDKDAEMFGADLVDMTKRAAQQEARQLRRLVETQAAQIERLASALEEQGKRVKSANEVVAMTAEQQFFANLDRALPNWQQLQDTPECQNWLVQTIPGTSLTWDNVIQTAVGQHNVAKCVEVFRAFQSAYPQFADTPVTPAPEAPRKSAKEELARQVAPNRTAASAPQTPTQQFMTASEFEEMGMKVVRLRAANKHAEAAELEQAMDAALAGGRVR